MGKPTFILLLLSSAAWAYQTISVDMAKANGGAAIAVANMRFCTLTDTALTDCNVALDQNWNYQRANAVAVGAFHSCNLWKGKVHCFGFNGRYQRLKVPALPPVSRLAAGTDNTCAIAKGRVYCWGNPSNDINESQPLEGVREIAVGESAACAIADDKIHCWGKANPDLIGAPQLNHPEQLGMGINHACVIDGGRVVCWGDNSHKQLDVPAFQNATQLAVGALHNCVVSENGVECWGDDSRRQVRVDPPHRFTHPVQVATGWGMSCALGMIVAKRNYWGVSCTGKTVVGPLFKRLFYRGGRYFESLKNQESDFANLSHNLYSEETEKFFFQLSRISKQHPPELDPFVAQRRNLYVRLFLQYSIRNVFDESKIGYERRLQDNKNSWKVLSRLSNNDITKIDDFEPLPEIIAASKAIIAALPNPATKVLRAVRAEQIEYLRKVNGP